MGGGLSKDAKDRLAVCKMGGGKDLNLTDCEISDLAAFKALVKLKLLVSLNLSRNRLKDIPPSIRQLENLEDLSLAFNEIEGSVPYEISLLKNLRVLNLEGNMLQNFPSQWSFMTMPKLGTLILSHNRIGNLPGDLARLSSLYTLVLENMNLTRIPESVLKCASLRRLELQRNKLVMPESLASLTHLEYLDLSDNSLVACPGCLGDLASLVELNLSMNSFGEFCVDLAKLKNLRFLRCSNGALISLAALKFDLMPVLDTLVLENNRITELPSSIRSANMLVELNISGNQLTSVPREIGWLDRQLRKLLLSNNRIETVPGELMYLNPAVELSLDRNPLAPPFSAWYAEGCTRLLENLRPYVRAFPQNCVAEGEHLSATLAAQPSKFLIVAMDRNGNPRVNGGDNFAVVFQASASESESSSRSFSAVPKDNKDGTYSVFFNSQFAGTFQIEITESDVPIRGSPFTCVISTGHPDPEKSEVQYPDQVMFAREKPYEFSIVWKDRFGNVLDRPVTNSEILVDVSQGLPPPHIHRDDSVVGKTSVRFSPQWAGEYEITVLVFGRPLLDGRWSITVK